MNIPIKSDREVEKMRKSGKILAQIFAAMEKGIVPDATGKDLEAIAKEQIKKWGAQAAFLGYNGYPAVSCISINHQLVHSIPSSQKFKSGDIVSVDMGVKLDGWYSDKARTYGVGELSPQRQRLIKITRQALKAGIKSARVGARLGDISSAIQKVIEGAGLTVIRDLAGHGIGRELHEAPSVYNFGKRGRGPILEAGMTLALEPMVAVGSYKIKIAPDKWTVETADKSDCAHFEDTIAITKKGPRILTNFRCLDD